MTEHPELTGKRIFRLRKNRLILPCCGQSCHSLFDCRDQIVLLEKIFGFYGKVSGVFNEERIVLALDLGILRLDLIVLLQDLAILFLNLLILAVNRHSSSNTDNRNQGENA